MIFTGKKGFTLIEILVVITIIGITISIVFPSYIKLSDSISAKLQEKKEYNAKKKDSFIAFIKDEPSND